jgi:2-keto-4-pentenoate hydratase/2-oxohepta-3-ene-1,7-dioic acid hydratase in catechol pathway
MRIAKIKVGVRTTTAVVDANCAHVIAPWSAAPSELVPFEAPSLTFEEINRRAQSADEVIPLNEVVLTPPAGPLSKFVCLGFNYKNHVEETHHDLSPNPTLFTKVSDALVGHGEPLVRPSVSEHFDYEGEIAVVIGKAGRHIPPESALDHVFGYTIMLDGSVRDYQKHSPTAGKNFWHSGSLGPWIVTADQIEDPNKLKLQTRLNGEIVQSTTADLMLYDIPTAIAYISRWTPLSPGDVIATGTPGGVGSRRTPPLWMKPGDTVEVEVSGVGVLANLVVDESVTTGAAAP